MKSKIKLVTIITNKSVDDRHKVMRTPRIIAESMVSNGSYHYVPKKVFKRSKSIG